MKPWLNRLIPILTHAGSLFPLVWLGIDGLTNHLTVNPVQAITQRSGQYALILLLVSLSVTPLNTLLHLPVLVAQRRALGLYAFLYTAIHLLSYTGLDYGFAWNFIGIEVINKRYLWVGTIAFLVLVPLALTSLTWWQKKLGKKWKTLHRLVYGVGVLAVLHFAWSLKGDLFRFSGDVFWPWLAAIILIVLLLMRLPVIRRFLAHRNNHINKVK